MLTRVIALRLQTILNKIINKNQTGFLKGWYIEDNLRVIRDALHILRCSNSAGFLVALDFSKAFDSLCLEFIYMVLRWYGFSPNFLSPVELISADIELSHRCRSVIKVLQACQGNTSRLLRVPLPIHHGGRDDGHLYQE